MTSYVLLCRHGPHESGRLVPVGEPPHFPTVSVAQVLRNRLSHPSPYGDDPIRLRSVLHSSALEVRQTVGLLARELGELTSVDDRVELVINSINSRGDSGHHRTTVVMCQHLNEASFAAAEDDKQLADWLLNAAAGRSLVAIDHCACHNGGLPDGNAILVVGHQPHLGWLSDALLRRGRVWRWRSFAVPFARAELVCLAFPEPLTLPWRTARRPGQVLWTIADDDRGAAEDVRAKIKSKMDTAKTLSGVITFGLGALLSLLLDPEKWSKIQPHAPVQIAAGLLFASLILYLASMYSYDRLLMPDRFWGEQRPRRSGLRRGRGWLVQRPPSSAAWVLYVNMMRVWRGLFTPATACVVTALTMLAAAALHLRAAQITIVVAPAAAIVGALVYWFRPVLGSED